MELWQYALWGLLGAAAVEGSEAFAVMRRTHAPPWRHKEGPAPTVFAWSVVIRLFLGAIVASVMGESGAVANAVGAFGVGLAAPVLIEKMLQLARHSGASDGGGGVNGG
ncbi:hypothetical protein ACIRPH_11425 [Nocardiopsis sp. NPDC101807]|uniref:hypothetical protein n=1 Tax=Nocardiopsis sp. NPDC101807 TaxID=3364339 RepID=UPI003808C724